jgi:predicted thioesterase
MQTSDFIQVGLSKEATYVVLEEHTAIHIGSGSLRVLATPWMIAFMERTARDLLGEHLPQGYSSVGVRVDVRHLAPSAVGSTITVRAVVQSVDGSKVNMHIEAHDQHEPVGEGEHQRVVIDEERFLRRVQAKAGG